MGAVSRRRDGGASPDRLCASTGPATRRVENGGGPENAREKAARGDQNFPLLVRNVTLSFVSRRRALKRRTPFQSTS